MDIYRSTRILFFTEQHHPALCGWWWNFLDFIARRRLCHFLPQKTAPAKDQTPTAKTPNRGASENCSGPTRQLVVSGSQHREMAFLERSSLAAGSWSCTQPRRSVTGTGENAARQGVLPAQPVYQRSNWSDRRWRYFVGGVQSLPLLSD